MADFNIAPINDQDRAMLEFAEALTKNPGKMERSHIEQLRSVGFCDTAIHDIVQVAAMFNYYNRIADGLGIEDEPEWKDQTRGQAT